MSFERTHKVIVYLLVIVGLIPLATSGEVPFAAIALTFIAVFHSWFRSAPLSRTQPRSRSWTVGTFMAALVCVLFGWVSGGRWLLAAILFALVMVVVRLYQGRTARDVFQLYGLTFISIIAGAVINPTIWFLFSFLAYVVLLVWGLVLLHLQRDLERLERDDDQEDDLLVDIDKETFDWKTRDLVSGRFLTGTSMLALGVFLTSLAFFFLFPRLGMGFFFGQGRKGQAVSGFSDSIKLGHFGTIKDNMQVVMRVEIPGDTSRGTRTLRMRGISFDHYDGKSWTKTTSKKRPLPRYQRDQWRVVYDNVIDSAGFKEKLVYQNIYVEPIIGDRRVVFAEPRLMALSINNARLDQLKRSPTNFLQGAIANADISTGPGLRNAREGQAAALQYTAVSTGYRPSNDHLRLISRIRKAYPPEVMALYTQKPVGLDPAIKREAERLTAGATTMHDKVLAIERHLLDNFTYSTEGGHDQDNPLSDFLFGRKSGHCEYFASGMVMLLRTLDIPARPANGFYGGAYNSYGSFYAVRQADAHSWVEVFYPGHGWVTYDPTPPAMVIVPPEDGFWAGVEEWFDSLRLRWYKWVVEYDLEKQLAFFTEIGKSIRSWFPSTGDSGTPDNSGKGWLEGLKAWANDPMNWVMLGLPVFLFLAWRLRWFQSLVAWIRRRREDALRNDPPAVAAYRRMTVLLARLGFIRRGSETPRELARRVALSGYPAADSVAYVTDQFEQARYRERVDLSESEQMALDTAVMAVGATKRS